MKLEFANTNKKVNSTAIVSSYPESFTGAKFKEECNLTFPVFMIGTNSITFTNYNYVKVTFDNNAIKYYFINSFELGTNQCWYIKCTMDVLATYKSDILSKQLYVLRSASNKNLNVVDTLYPTLSKYYTDYTDNTNINTVHVYDMASDASYSETASNYFNKYNVSGYYYVKVVGDATNGTTPVTYCMDWSNFTSFMKQVFTVDYTQEFPDIAAGVSRGVANILQYIVEAYWLPVRKPGISFVSQDIKLGVYTIEDITCVKMLDPGGVLVDFQIKSQGQRTVNFNHPQISRGNWLNTAPYTKRVLIFYPFGVYDLAQPEDAYDPLQTGMYEVEITVDLFTGQAMIKIFTTSENIHYQHLLVTDVKDYKVPIQLSEASLTLVGAIGAGIQNIGAGPIGALSGLAMGVASGGLGNIVSSLGTALSSGLMAEGFDKMIGSITPFNGIGTALQAAGTEIKTNGTTGAFLPYRISPRLFITFTYISDGNYDHDGYPLCEEKTLSSLSGYCLCKDNDIGITNATKDQLEMIKEFLVTGFFIE